jgi:hypothetical protein
MTAQGQTFTFRSSNERRLSGAEADQALTSQECQFLTFRGEISVGSEQAEDR